MPTEPGRRTSSSDGRGANRTVRIEVSPEIYDKLTELAEEEDVGLTAYCRNHLVRHARETNP